MPIFGLTGNLASGKTTVLRLLEKKGCIVFDADKRIHQYYRDKNSNIYKSVVSVFPQAYTKGLISRNKLRDIVFSDAKFLYKLEKIVHPVIIKDLKEWISEKRKGKIYVAEVPLLFEKRLQDYFNGVILVYVKKEILVKRIINKQRISKEQVASRLRLYLPIREKIKKANFIIDNSYTLADLNEKVDLLWNRLKLKVSG
jgi:dephospho-CoA kinase